MTTAFAAYQTATHKMRHLTTVDRGIREENLNALLRRWTHAQQGYMDDAKVMQRWFPGQRELMCILSAISIEQCEELADCSLPLFTLRLPAGLNEACYKPADATSGFEKEAYEEVFIALMTRLDGLRTQPDSMPMLYDMGNTLANSLGRLSTRQLLSLSSDPSVHLAPAVTDEYFVLSAVEKLNGRERTVLASTTRRQRLM